MVESASSMPGRPSSLRKPSAPRDWRAVARLIDHTLLRPEATSGQVERLCAEAVRYGFATVCVNPVHVALAASFLGKTKVGVATVVGFPLGAGLSKTKRFESLEAIRQGATELDMVMNIGALKSGELRRVEDDIRAVTAPAQNSDVLVKVILETALLTDEEKRVACELAVAAGADFVKTCTGFGGGGATAADVALMRSVVGKRAGVKASAGIRTAEQVAALVEAGANRIGTSSSIAIVRELGAPGPEGQG